MQVGFVTPADLTVKQSMYSVVIRSPPYFLLWAVKVLFPNENTLF